MPVSRRTALAAAALPLFAIRARAADAPEFSWKISNNVPAAHPLALRQSEAAARIKEATGGRLDIQVFPANQLGSDTDVLSQLRSGAVEMQSISGLILATLVPAASLNGVGFAFKDYATVWPAMDGGLGAYIRGEIDRRGLVTMERIWDNGFRQITSSTRQIAVPADLRGFKIRVPVSPLWTGLFQALGAAPASINFSETYSALQTKIVEGQENPLPLIQFAKLYEVQRWCALTSHMWDGYWQIANRRAWNALPPAVQEVVAREMNRSALDERADIAALNGGVQAELASKGLAFNEVDKAAFRDALKAAGFYADWKARFGEPAWTVLEGEVGRLT